MEIDSKTAYWNAVDWYWDKIVAIFIKVGAPLTEPYQHGDLTTGTKTLLEHLIHLKTKRDPEIARWFNLAWAAAPDDPSIHYWEGWSMFCDLCSETWVFEPEENNDG